MADFVFGSAASPVDAVVQVPGSKSITNRALVMASLADGTSILSGILLAQDTWLMIDALMDLGVRITVDETTCRAEISGNSGHIEADEADIFCGNSGTTIRFCTALAALGREGRYRLDGIDRMRRRPIGALGDALQSLGAGIEYPDEQGFPPLVVRGHGLRGGQVSFESPGSSQYVSAILMASPYASGEVLIGVSPDAPSRPFIQMTMSMMEAFGVPVLADGVRGPGPMRMVVEGHQMYRACRFDVEPDATNAMYFLSIPAVVGGRVRVGGLGKNSIQGDLGFLELLERSGCKSSYLENGIKVTKEPEKRLPGGEFDLGCMPDLAPTLAVLALFADGPTVIRNVANLRIKESDRIAALSRELCKFGATVEELADGLRIMPPRCPSPAVVETYDDHRLAMSLALAGLRLPGTVIRGAECAAKTYPDFFEDFAAAAGLLGDFAPKWSYGR